MNNFHKTVLFIFLTFLGCATSSTYQGPSLYGTSDAFSLAEKAWDALKDKDFQAVHRYADECIRLYAQQAKALNGVCDTAAPPVNENCVLLNDFSQCIFVKAQAYFETKDYEKFKSVCAEINEFYFNSTIFDPKGWVWKPADYCKSKIEEINRQE